MSGSGDVMAVLPGVAAPVSGEPPSASAPALAPPAADASRWLTRYRRLIFLVDTSALVIAGVVAVRLRFDGEAALRGVSYYGIAGLIAVSWLLLLSAGRCYEPRFLGNGSEEFRRVGNTSVRLAAVVAMVGYGARIDIARGFVAAALPLGAALLLLGRWLCRVWLHHARRNGRCNHRVVLVGSPSQVVDLARQLQHEPNAGLQVVGVCVPAEHGDVALGAELPVLGTLSTVTRSLVAANADTVAVASSPDLAPDALRALSYELEGTGVDLLVAPGLTNVTGTRISIRPIAGLPLLHVDEPELSGGRKLLKAVFDRVVALVLLVMLVPVLLGVSVAVRLTSSGPALFKQRRVGRDGELFDVWKFRSMYVGAERRQAAIQALNEHDGVLFKIRQDPRVTPLGRWLRKFSLDELPQLFNVLRGQMSLVGPRPPLPSEVERYEGHAHRRLLVKPGITGLWQVSGRADLTWDETVRLDLHYVENWSLGLDLAVLAKTTPAVQRGRGAY